MVDLSSIYTVLMNDGGDDVLLKYRHIDYLVLCCRPSALWQLDNVLKDNVSGNERVFQRIELKLFVRREGHQFKAISVAHWGHLVF